VSVQFYHCNKIMDYRKKLTSLPLGLRQAVFMFAATTISSALNYLVHFASSRMLGPVEYGVFVSLNSFYLLISTPLGILTIVTAYYLAQFHARFEDYRSRLLLIDISKWVSLIGVILGVVIAVSSPFLATFLQIPSSTPILMVAIAVLVGSLLAVLTGALQGLQKFFAFGFVAITGGFLRLSFAVGLVALGLGATGALAAQFIAGIASVALALIVLAPLLRQTSSSLHSGHGLTLREVIDYAGLVLIGTICLATLTNLDVMVIKHYFPPEEAGQYAAASVLAKIILFFPTAITAVLFPKVVERFALQQDSSRIARQAAAAVGGLCGALVVMYFIIPDLLIRVLFGQGYENAVPLVGPFGVTMALYALVTLQMTYYLAIHKMRYIALLAGSTILLVTALVYFHNSLLEVIIIQLINATALLMVGELTCRGIIYNNLPKITK
jgi:O-antigen/teichoic acid export membrane protein